MRHQEQHGLLWRLLECLQDGVGAEPVEFVDCIDDCHAPTTKRRPQGEEVDKLAHAVDRDLRFLLALVVDGPPDDPQVRMTACHYETGERRLGCAEIRRHRPSSRIAKRSASRALPTPRGPRNSQPWCNWPDASAARKSCFGRRHGQTPDRGRAPRAPSADLRKAAPISDIALAARSPADTDASSTQHRCGLACAISRNARCTAS